MASRIHRRTLLKRGLLLSAAGGASSFLPFSSWASAESSQPPVPRQVSWFATTAERPWRQVTSPLSGFQWDSLDILVNPRKSFQAVDGFGACFNELGWTALNALNDQDRKTIFDELFSPGVGANLTFCRLPIGANDFSRDWYSYDESPNDFSLRRFSIENDLQTIVPFVRQALSYAPHLRLWASPWSPPSWMKKNGFYAEAPQRAGLPSNRIRPDQVGHEGQTMFIEEERYYKAYADYFSLYVQAYKGLGVKVGMVMPQNEFNSAQPFPSCTWTPQALVAFLRHLGPQMQQQGVDIFFGTLERGDPRILQAVLADGLASQYIRGVGVQWAGKNAVPVIHERYPHLKIMQSEQECGDGKNDWEYCTYCWRLMKFYLTHGANAYMYWNICLTTGGESHWGWSQDSLITVDPATRSYHFNHEYYLLKHVSHFVRTGAVRIETAGTCDDALAFLNPDQSIVVVVRNPESFQRPLNIKIGEDKFSGLLEGDSINTIFVPS